ncbi:MAG: peptide chain release factor 3, partial [Vallitaleaceae bacterium]|nr:peptide chain release factor 3 [Vallitaleaceae bacterium]
RKHFVKGLNQLAEEGTVQIYKRPHSGVEELIIGVVGMLQFEVLDYRLKNEYGVETTHQQLPYKYIRWIEPETFDIDTLSLPADSILVFNDKEQPIILYSYEWAIRHLMDRNKKLVLRETSI